MVPILTLGVSGKVLAAPAPLYLSRRGELEEMGVKK